MSSCHNTREIRQLLSQLYVMASGDEDFDIDDFNEVLDEIYQHLDEIEDLRDCED